jgi:hypothetical protein
MFYLVDTNIMRNRRHRSQNGVSRSLVSLLYLQYPRFELAIVVIPHGDG